MSIDGPDPEQLLGLQLGPRKSCCPDPEQHAVHYRTI